MKIGFIGLGKLGLPCAMAMESRGNTVMGFDHDPKIKTYLELRKVPYKENDIQDYLDKTDIKLVDPYNMVGNCDIIFVAVQTPHGPEYEGITRLPSTREDFDYSFLKEAVKSLAEIATKKGVSQIVAIISTVLPGTIDKHIKPIIAKEGHRLQLVYNPFFIAMGTTIEDVLKPEFVLLGVDDPEASKVVENFY